MLVVHVDPSREPAAEVTLVEIDGRAPTEDEITRWRAEGGDEWSLLGELPPLARLFDLKGLERESDDLTAVTFGATPREGMGGLPPESFRVTMRINKATRAFEDLQLRLRDSVKVAPVLRLTEAGYSVRFQTIRPGYPPQPVALRMGMAVGGLWLKQSKHAETVRYHYRRVEPWSPPKPAE